MEDDTVKEYEEKRLFSVHHLLDCNLLHILFNSQETSQIWSEEEFILAFDEYVGEDDHK